MVSVLVRGCPPVWLLNASSRGSAITDSPVVGPAAKRQSGYGARRGFLAAPVLPSSELQIAETPQSPRLWALSAQNPEREKKVGSDRPYTVTHGAWLSLVGRMSR